MIANRRPKMYSPPLTTPVSAVLYCKGVAVARLRKRTRSRALGRAASPEPRIMLPLPFAFAFLGFDQHAAVLPAEDQSTSALCPEFRVQSGLRTPRSEIWCAGTRLCFAWAWVSDPSLLSRGDFRWLSAAFLRHRWPYFFAA